MEKRDTFIMLLPDVINCTKFKFPDLEKRKSIQIQLNTRVSQKFCNILVRASLQHIFYMAEAVQVMVSTLCSW